MDAEQLNVISKYFPKLWEMTSCSDLFLSRFYTHILNDDDLEAIDIAGKTYGRFRKCKTFFDIIQSRSGSFEVLMEALRHTNQTGVLALLQDISGKSACRRPHHEDTQVDVKTTKYDRFYKPPDYISQFLRDSSKTVLIVNSKDGRLTCDRICETVKNCRYYKYKDFLGTIGKLPQPTSTYQLPIVNCENRIRDMIHWCKNVKEKVVIVGSHEDDSPDPTHCKVDDQIRWKDLSPLFGTEIQEKIESWFSLESSEYLTDLNDAEPELILQLIKSKRPNLFKNTIPEVLKYYIPRRLVTRNVISSNILTHRGPDVFLIKGVDRPQLSELTNASPTTTSSDVINGKPDTSTKFVLLEDDIHFDKVVKFAAPRPVHMFQYKDGNFCWLKSSGAIGSLQNDIEPPANQTIQNEDDFVENLVASSSQHNIPVCISDSPGMGKTVLLANIGTKLQDIHGRGSVGFVVISELVASIKRFEKDAELNEHVFCTVAKYLCENLLGVAYLRKTKHALNHLLLDGFDEVNASDVKIAYQLLNVLREIFPDTKIWVTTRPHMLLEIEKCLGVLGHNIKAFEEEDQIKFLEMFWSRLWLDETKINAVDKLTNIARECLRSVKSKIDTRKEEDIAGIPLQCLLIGEVFEDVATEYCTSDSAILPVINVKSISDLYQQIVDMKFDKFMKLHPKRGLEREDLKQAHIYYSMALLFPSHLKLLANEQQKLSLQDIFNVGIIESKCTPPVPRFIHRTLAEYFLALYILDSITSSWNAKKSTLFLNQVLQSKRATLRIRKITLKTHEFRHNVICYFIDEYLSIYEGIKFVNRSIIPVSKLQKISEACAYGCYEKMFIKLFCPLTMVSKYSKIYSEHFLIVCTLLAGETMSSKAFENYLKLNYGRSLTDINMQESTLLHFAVIRGNYSLVEHLLKKHGFKEYIFSEFNKFSTLIHDCVCDSLPQDVRIIKGKRDIITYLATVKQDLLTNKDINRNIPMLSPRLHPILAKQLIKLTKHNIDVTQTLQFIHSCLKEYDCEDFTSILQHIVDEKSKDFFESLWTSELAASSLIHDLFKLIQPGEKLLNLLKSYRIDFCVEDSQKSVLEVAIAHNRDTACLKWLIRNIHFTKEQLETAYVQAVKRLNVDAVTTLLLEQKVDANLTVGKNKSNMFHILFKMPKSKVLQQHINMARLLVENGVSVNHKNVSKETAMYIFMNLDLAFRDDWWNLFDVLFSQTQKLPASNVTLKKVEFMLHGVDFESFSLYSLLDECITENDANRVNSSGDSLLHLLWNFKRYSANICAILIQVWKMLISNGADPLLLNKKDETPIDKLIQRKIDANYCIEAVTHALTQPSSSDNSKMNNILVSTVKPHAQLKVIKSLCDWFTENRKRPVNTIIGTYQGKRVTMLDMALLSYDGDVLEYLIRTCDCKKTLQPFGKYWIHKCVEHQWSFENGAKFIKLVSDMFPDLINAPNGTGLVPLSMKLVNPNFVLRLVKLGANINAVDPQGNTPLHWALKNHKFYSHVSEYFTIVKVIVVCGADVNAVTANNETPLMISMKLDNDTIFKSVFKLLLYNNADPAKRDSSGNTVLHYLPKRKFGDTGDLHEIVEHLLQKRRVKLFYLPNHDGMSPIDIIRQIYPQDAALFKLINNYRTGVVEQLETDT